MGIEIWNRNAADAKKKIAELEETTKQKESDNATAVQLETIKSKHQTVEKGMDVVKDVLEVFINSKK